MEYWFSWLSKSSLEPSLVYDYSLAFARHELQGEDLVHFDHQFLQSMGISVARHRLEILRVAKKELGSSSHNIYKLILAIKKTQKCLRKCIKKWVFHEEDSAMFKAVLRKQQTLSGPLVGRVQERWMLKSRSLKFSGPLDRQVNRSLKLSGHLDGRVRSTKVYGPNKMAEIEADDDGKYSLWIKLFQDIKPT